MVGMSGCWTGYRWVGVGVGGGMCFGFLWWLFDGRWGGVSRWCWMWVVFSGLLRVLVACDGRFCFGLGLGAVCV